MREGWLSLTRDAAAARGIHYNNQSVGAAPSLYMPYRLHDLRLLDKADRVILDFCINDQMFMDAKVYDLDRVAGHYLAAFHQLAQRRMLSKTLVLLFPQQPFVETGTPCMLIEMLRALCAQFGVAVLDAGALIVAEAARQSATQSATQLATQPDPHSDPPPSPVSDAYADPRHFSPDCQRLIGAEVMRTLPRMRRLPGLTAWTNRRALQILPRRLFRPLLIEPQSRIPRRRVGTSLAQWQVWSMPPKAEAQVSGAALLLGMFHWTHADAGAFCLQGPEEARRFHLRRVWENVFLIDAFRKPFRIGEAASLQVVNDRAIPHEKLQAQISSIYDCTTSTVDLVALLGADLSPDEVTMLVAQCHAICTEPVGKRLRALLLTRLGLRRAADQGAAESGSADTGSAGLGATDHKPADQGASDSGSADSGSADTGSSVDAG